MLVSKLPFALLGLGIYFHPLALDARAQTLDSLNVTIKGQVRALALQPDGKILLGGNFTNIGGVARVNIARLNPDGSMDFGFSPGTSGWPSNVASIVVQPDRKILIGGHFEGVGGHLRSGLARLQEDGAVDTSFTPESCLLLAMALEPGGKLVAGADYSIFRIAADGAPDPSLRLSTDHSVFAVAVQRDGKILVGGEFQTIGGQSCPRLARINTDGTLDKSFRPSADSRVNCLLAQPDGRILVGGTFSNLCGQPRRFIGRLNADGTLDNSFSVYTTGSGEVNSIAPQTDGKIILSGATVRDGSYGAQVARVLSNGQLDTTFPPYTFAAPSVALQQDGKILMAGSTRLSRLNAPDAPTQSLSIDNSSVTWQRGGSAPELVDATVYTSSNGFDWVALGHATPTPDGWQLTGLSLGAGSTVRASGVVATGGWHGSASLIEASVGRPAFVTDPNSRTVITGQTASFISGAAGTPPLLYQWQHDGTDVVGATNAWLTLTNVQSTAGGLYCVIVNNGLGAITSSPVSLTVVSQVSVEEAFNPTTDFSPFVSKVYSSAIQPDGKILLGGGFTNISGKERLCLARLHSNGELDLSFDPQLGGASELVGVAVQPDGRIVIAGRFTSVGGVPRANLARVLPDGKLDATFAPEVNNSLVRCIALQWDGKVLVAGGLIPPIGGLLTRLNADGSRDPEFAFSSNREVTCVTLQPNGKLLVSGWFTNINGVARQCIARLHQDGSLDDTFTSPFKVPNGIDLLGVDLVNEILLLPDGDMLVTPFLTSYARPVLRLNAAGSVVRAYSPLTFSTPLAVQADGKVLYGGSSEADWRVPYIGRLLQDGSPDPTFANPGGTNAGGYNQSATVARLNLQPDGEIFVSGVFTALGALTRTNLARLHNTEPADQQLTVNASTVQWLRAGTAPEVWRTTFEVSHDGSNWEVLGTGLRVPGGWELSNVTVEQNAVIRVRGDVLAARRTGSWFVESYTSPVIIDPELRAGGLGFDIAGLAGRDIVIESSTDLRSWTACATNRLEMVRSYVYVPGVIATNSGPQFYRLRTQR